MSGRNVRRRLDLVPASVQRSPAVATTRRGKRVARSRHSRGGVHAFTRWGVPSQHSTVSGQGSLNFNSNVTYSSGTIVTNPPTGGVVEIPLSTQFTLTDISGNAEFAALYDQYRLNGVKVSIKMISNPDANYLAGSTPVNQYTNYYPTLWYTPDYDDNGLLTLEQIREYKAVKHVTLRPNKEISIFIKPRLLRQIFNSNTGAGYEIAVPSFLDMANNALPHYGLKMVIDFEGMPIPINTVLNQWRFRINYKYYFECKDVR